MDWTIQDIARLAGTTSRTLRHYDDVGLREAEPHRRQRVPLLRRGRPGAAAARAAAARARARHPRHRRGAGRAARRHASRCARTWSGSPRSRSASTGRSPASSAPSQNWKEVRNRWQRRCSTASTTPSTRTRSSSAGAQSPTRRATPGGARSRRAEKDDFRLAAAELIEAWKAAAASGVAPDRRRGAGARAAPVRLAERHPRHAADAGRRARRRTTTPAWPRCTSPTSGSRRTTAASRARPSCATRCWRSPSATSSGSLARGRSRWMPGPRRRRGTRQPAAA